MLQPGGPVHSRPVPDHFRQIAGRTPSPNRGGQRSQRDAATPSRRTIHFERGQPSLATF